MRRRNDNDNDNDWGGSSHQANASHIFHLIAIASAALFVIGGSGAMGEFTIQHAQQLHHASQDSNLPEYVTSMLQQQVLPSINFNHQASQPESVESSPVQRDRVRRRLEYANSQSPDFETLDEVRSFCGDPPACSSEPQVDQGREQQAMPPQPQAVPSRKRKSRGKGKRKHKKKSKTMTPAEAPDHLVDEDAQLAQQDAVEQEQLQDAGHTRPADHSSDSEGADEFANAHEAFGFGTPGAAAATTSTNSPVNGVYEPIVPGSGKGIERTPSTDIRIRANADRANQATRNPRYKMEGLPRGILQGIPWVRHVILCMLALLPHAVRQRYYEKDRCKMWTCNILQVVSKFMMWLVRVRDIDINDLYDIQSFMQHLTHDTISSFIQHLTDAGFKQSSLKNLEYHLATFLKGLARYAQRKTLASPDSLLELNEMAQDLKSSGSKRGTWARKEAREQWTKKKICQKLGVTREPTPGMLWGCYKKMKAKARQLLQRMQRAYNDGLAMVEQGAPPGTPAAMAILALSDEDHMMLQSLLAVMLSLHFQGARCTFMNQMTPSWLTNSGGIYSVDPTKDAHLLKTKRWSRLARRVIRSDLGDMLGTYNRMFYELLGSQQGHEDEWHIFWLGDASASTIDAVRNIFHSEDGMWQLTEEEMENETMYGEHQVAWMQTTMIDQLSAAVLGARPTNSHFMHHALHAVFVGYLGAFTDINQLTFRHLMAWMAYQVWYLQETHDMVHQPSRTLGQTFDRMVELAAADANNSQDEWLNTYAPDGMSRMTQRQEQEALANERDSSSEDELSAHDDYDLCAYCSGDGGGGRCTCGNVQRQVQAQINADGGASVAQMEQLRDADEAEEDQEEMNGAAQSHASAEGVWDYDNGADDARYYDSDGSYYVADTEPFNG